MIPKEAYPHKLKCNNYANLLKKSLNIDKYLANIFNKYA